MGKRILIATYPFGTSGNKPYEILKETGWELVSNPYKRRLKAGEVGELIKEVDAVIAGTEPYVASELAKSSRLKTINRVGIGLDNVDLIACKNQGIIVTYTPDAPSQSVAELTIANIINLVRHVHESDKSVREGAWNRLMGFLLREVTIGIVGVGRIGKIVCGLLEQFKTKIIACDIDPDYEFGKKYDITWCDKEELLSGADVISLHIPMNKMNFHYIDRKSIARMKTGVFLLNTSRGQIIDEDALLDALKQNHIAGAYLDVFTKEPYDGPLAHLDNVILTAHMGASANESRFEMELGAAEDCLRVLKGEKPMNIAPIEE